MGKRVDVTCAICGTTVRKHRQQETCSMKCRSILRALRKSAQAETGRCPACANVLPLPFTAHGERVCSRRCAGTIYSRQFRDKDGYNRNKYRSVVPRPFSMVCRACGTIFLPRTAKQKCCSIQCNNRWHSRQPAPIERRLARYSKNRDLKLANIKGCALCGIPKEDILLPSQLGRRSKFGNSALHEDHIVPKSYREATDTRYLCWFCNLARKDNDPIYDEAIAQAGKAFWATVRQIYGNHARISTEQP